MTPTELDRLEAMLTNKAEQPTICFLVRRKEMMPDGSIGAVFIGEFAGDRSKDLRLTIAQAETLRDQLTLHLGARK